ncbi:hypothetical protein CVT25_000632 [Psilocybe cyanescens]|uniref:Uncharacterized protein n=1 Tax=Psilocybe cyanescens TaxID=93625 RepID=A0A409WZD4_PSICY|nr:hypothetical protein CVT25_000632 [Psilocybe cyanescens]
MATVQLSPNTPSAQSKKGVFASGNYARRASSSSGSLNSSSTTPQGIGYSPGTPTYNTTPTSPAGSGIPAFRTLRSLLPFGPNKNATSSPSLSSPSTSRSPFANFGSVRRSMTRERKSSLSNDAMTPVISIERSNGSLADETTIRRSASLSLIEKPLPREPKFDNISGSYQEDGILSNGDGTLRSAFTLRTPSPGPPLTAELSTIMEADSSGVSKNLPDGITVKSTSSSPHRTTSQNFLHPHRHQGSSTTKTAQKHSPRSDSLDFDISAFNLSTTEVENQVRDALRKSASSSKSGEEWLKADKAVVIIDADEHPEAVDKTLNPDTVDADLLALLSPNSGTRNSSSKSLNRTPDHRQRPSVSPTTPTFPPSPVSRFSRAQQASSLLPRLRSSPSASPTSPRFSISTPSPTTPSMSNATTTPKATQDKVDTAPVKAAIDFSPPSPSPSLASAPTSTPAAPRRTLPSPRSPSMFSQPSLRATNLFGGRNRSNDDTTPQSKETPTTSRLATRTLRQVMLGSGGSNRSKNSPSSNSDSSQQVVTPLSRGSLDSGRPPAGPSLGREIGLGRPSLDMRRTSFDSRIRLQISRGSASPERSERPMTEAEFSPSREVEDTPFDSTVARQSVDANYLPGSVLRLREREREREREWERDRTPSLRVTDSSGDSVSPIPRVPHAPPRSRKRSMSVQEHVVEGRYVNTMAVSENGAYGARISRPGSSASAHGGQRTFGDDEGSGSRHEIRYESPVGGSGGAAGPKMEWLGPRTAKAFKAAGLLDFDRDRSKEKEKSGGDGFNRMRDRTRSNSVIVAPSPSPLGASGTSSSGARFNSARSASEYNYNPGHTRAHSRMAYSEVGGATSGRRGSDSFGGSSYGGGSPYNHQGLMESPTFTVSSSSRDRDRDTPRSGSTAPTSLAESFGYLGRDRDRLEREREREREEVRDLKEKHGNEMGALLNALSDAQRTTRLLREENSQLRDRLEDVSVLVQQNNDLRHAFDSVERECSGLRRELAALRAVKAPGLTPSWSGSSGTSSGFRTPLLKPGNSSPLVMDSTPSFIRHSDEQEQEHEQEEAYNNTIIIHNSINDQREYASPEFDPDAGDPSGDFLPPTSTPSIKRKRSDTSSIFPIPPSNMAMLLHDDTNYNMDGNRSIADQSQYPFALHANHQTSKTVAAPRAIPHSRSGGGGGTHSLSQSHSPPYAHRDFAGPGHINNKSITSTTSISPTIANFSMVTGSPGSLYLRPEHEILLGDMESLDLGVLSGPESEPGRTSGDDGW